MDIFIARQPIFNAQRQVVAYELLFRDGVANAFSAATNGTEATSQVMASSLMLFGIRALTGGKKAFINVTREVLTNDYLHLFPHDLVVPEILEDIRHDAEVVAACLRLKKAGYEIALDDVVKCTGREVLEPFLDILKVDFLNTDEEMQRQIAEYFAPRGIKLLAEKVETVEVFDWARSLGFTLFQGYFFARPEVMAKKTVPGDKVRYLQLVRQINRAEIDLDQVESLIKQDVSLSYRLLRYINSAFFSWRVEIRSIRQALVLLGQSEIKKWATLVSVTFMGQDKPPALIVTALTRARFCEFLAPQVGLAKQAQDLFLMGMFSLLDALVDRPIKDILEEMPISPIIKGALLGEQGSYNTVLQMAICYERGDWPEFSRLSAILGATEQSIPSVYVNAVDWATQSVETTLSVAPGSIVPPPLT